MSENLTTPVHVSRAYYRSHQDPVKYAREIAAVAMFHDPDSHLVEHVWIILDQSVIHHMGWHPGEPITLVPVLPGPDSSEGKLIIRRARRNEPAYILDETPISAPRSTIESFPEICGPVFSWSFPAPWVAMFFPGWYDEQRHEFNAQDERRWRLIDIAEQADQIELVMSPATLFLSLHRTDSARPILDLNLIPGLLHTKGWTRDTALILESATGFDPSAAQDLLTIRERRLGEEPNLVATAGRFTASINPLWLNRFFPDVYDPSAVAPDPWEAVEEPSEIDESAGQPIWDEREDSAIPYRDTLVVNYRDLISKGHTLSFEITPPRPTGPGE